MSGWVAAISARRGALGTRLTFRTRGLTLRPFRLRARSRLLTLLLGAFRLLPLLALLLLLRAFGLLLLLALLLLRTLSLLPLLLRALHLLLLSTFNLLLHRPTIGTRCLSAWRAVGTWGAFDRTFTPRLAIAPRNLSRTGSARRRKRRINALRAPFRSGLRRALGPVAGLWANAAQVIARTLDTRLLANAWTLDTIRPLHAIRTLATTWATACLGAIANLRTIDPFRTTSVAGAIRA